MEKEIMKVRDIPGAFLDMNVKTIGKILLIPVFLFGLAMGGYFIADQVEHYNDPFAQYVVEPEQKAFLTDKEMENLEAKSTFDPNQPFEVIKQ